MTQNKPDLSREERISQTVFTLGLTLPTIDLFREFARRSELEGRDPEVTDTSPEDKGRLTHLKKAGLLTTYVCPGDPWQALWVSFTPRGRAFASRIGITVYSFEGGER